MKTPTYFAAVLGAVCLYFQPLLSDPPGLRDQMKSCLDTIAFAFETNYAPKEWKKSWCGWDLYLQLERAKSKIDTMPNLTLKEYQRVVRDFLISTQDYHVGVHFFSTESASLPFQVSGAEGRYFITHIDRQSLSSKKFPFGEGDELVSMDGQPIENLIQKLIREELAGSGVETDRKLAEIILVKRKGSLGHKVPCGQAIVEIKPKNSKKSKTVSVKWDYREEELMPPYKWQASPIVRKKESAKKEYPGFGIYVKPYVSPLALELSSIKNSTKEVIGAKRSFVPPLGVKVWEAPIRLSFYAYIFEDRLKRKIGYLRIPHFSGSDEQIDELGQVLSVFNHETEALVLDQVNNPGGYLMYLYAVASLFADEPLVGLNQKHAITQADVVMALNGISQLEAMEEDQYLIDDLGETIQGYPVDFEFCQKSIAYFNSLIDNWNSGKVMTDSLPIFGIDRIKPHLHYSYQKPILMLVNSLDFSCADILPALLQDNERALIFGSKTAGAGGYVLEEGLRNRLGIAFFTYTGSLIERKSLEPLENLGVTPDIPYEITVQDLQNNYEPYKEAILDALEFL